MGIEPRIDGAGRPERARPAAVAVGRRGVSARRGGRARPGGASPAPWRSLLAALFLLALMGGWRAGALPLAVAAGYGAMSAVSALLYRRDKRAARAGAARTRERTLHLADLLGGWPGGLIAQERLRHKTRRTSFQLVFWATAVLHCAALGLLLGAGL